MTCLAPADAVVMRATADALTPPPSPDPWTWACEHLVFGPKSPRPGPLDQRVFAWAQRILECLNPEHPAREVTLRGSAQFGKTETIIGAALGCWFDRDPCNVLVVHPTGSAAADWAKDKWASFRAENARMRVVFGRGSDRDSIDFQPTLDRRGILYVENSGSPSGLSGKTCPRVVKDDLAKWEPNPKGDPETLADSRAGAFEDGAKILSTSTPMVRGACRISRAYERGTAEVWEVPCPHCGEHAALEWENFEPNIDAENPAAAHFTCPRCGGAIEESHRDAIVPLGRWRATNPKGDHPSFHMWRAYMPFRSWESIARAWLVAKGDAAAEQTVYNDVLGLPYEQASEAPKWEALRDRTENAAPADQTPLGRIPPRRPLLTAGVDCQGDRLEATIRAHGRDGRAHTVLHLVIPHHIGEDAAHAALDALLKRTWRNAAGRDLPLDRLTIDGGTYTDDVWAWAKRHPWNRVCITKGASSGTGPIYALQKFERRADGKVKRAQKRAYVVNVSALKAKLYADLRKEDPEARGFQSFATGLGDAYFRQLAAERRVLRRNRFGVMESRWEIAESDGRNEALDCAIMADVAARLAGSATMGDAEWDALEAARDTPPAALPGETPDLFDAPPPVAAAPPKATTAAAAVDPVLAAFRAAKGA
jgi:phage terminase large subunit GpA-like protein